MGLAGFAGYHGQHATGGASLVTKAMISYPACSTQRSGREHAASCNISNAEWCGQKNPGLPVLNFITYWRKYLKMVPKPGRYAEV